MSLNGLMFADNLHQTKELKDLPYRCTSFSGTFSIALNFVLLTSESGKFHHYKLGLIKWNIHIISSEFLFFETNLKKTNFYI